MLELMPAKNESMAFLPETLKYSPIYNPAYGSYEHRYAMAGYWHEIKKGKRIAVYGEFIFCFTKKEVAATGLPLEDLPYQTVLALARTNARYNCNTGRNSYIKLGHSKPWKSQSYMRDHDDDFAKHLDLGFLENMLTNPDELTKGVDGWYYFVNRR